MKHRWFSAQRPGSGWDLFGYHGLWAVLSGAALAVSAFLPISSLPAIACWFNAWIHRPCPFCGLTRSVMAAGHGRWSEAWQQAPFGVLLFAAVALFFAWHCAGLLAGRILRVALPGRVGRTILLAALAALAANWIYRWSAGFDR